MPCLKTLARAVLALATGLALSAAAHADINAGVIVSPTGAGASLGIPADNTIKRWPTEPAGQKVKLFVLNDAIDTTNAAQNATTLITDGQVEVIVGPSLTPTSLAVIEVAARSGVPVTLLAGGGAIVEPHDVPRRRAFKVASTETISTHAVPDPVPCNTAGTVATIGITTACGEGFLKAIERLAPAKCAKIVAIEKYAQADTSATPQVLELIAPNSDAVYAFSAGTPSALPHVERVKRDDMGQIDQTQGVAKADFLRIGGKALEGSAMTVAPVRVADRFADANPVKAPGLDPVTRYEANDGAGARTLFGATAWAAQLWQNGAIPVALNKGKPGTEGFRLALRDAIEGPNEFVGAQGVFKPGAKDHNGVGARSQVMAKVEGAQWRLVT